ncbi:hypothetical protein N7463_006750 [Penicillium fimorum]|uniref:Uncharacterized protein n=1 Tax=Penicillium fimorum TaxID=1882269 RepID=A0A9W9XVW4_9EURO|nr:hypothetical protein N7463_006750 [Penicillium fimorum]
MREFNFENVRQLGRCARAVDTTQRQREIKAGSAHHRHLQQGVSQEQLQKAICALQQQKGPRTLRSLAKARSRTRELLLGSPDHTKRLLRSSVFSWR